MTTAASEIQVTIHCKRRWFFWPCFYTCYAAARLGADSERMAEFLANRCFDLEVV